MIVRTNSYWRGSWRGMILHLLFLVSGRISPSLTCSGVVRWSLLLSTHQHHHFFFSILHTTSLLLVVAVVILVSPHGGSCMSIFLLGIFLSRAALKFFFLILPDVASPPPPPLSHPRHTLPTPEVPYPSDLQQTGSLVFPLTVPHYREYVYGPLNDETKSRRIVVVVVVVMVVVVVVVVVVAVTG